MALFTGAFFVAQVSLIIVAKPFYAIFCTSCVPHHENPRIIVGKVVENFYTILRDFTELIKISGITSKNGRNDAKRFNIRVVTVSNDDKPKNRETQRKADLRRRMVCKSLPVKE